MAQPSSERKQSYSQKPTKNTVDNKVIINNENGNGLVYRVDLLLIYVLIKRKCVVCSSAAFG